MPRLTTVKKAEQRYRTVPVIDPETGAQKVVPVLNKRTGEPKTNKAGRAITRRLTVADKTQPLPNRRCGKCGTEIEPGMSYRWWSNKLPGSFGSGQKSIRCIKMECYPKSWEMDGNPKRQALGQAQEALEEALSSNFDEASEVESALSDFAESIREIAQEMIDGAENMESGFGHATYASDELRERGENLEQQADDCEQVYLDDRPEQSDYMTEDVEDCPECDGEGEITAEGEEEPEQCMTCDGDGVLTEEVEDEQAYEDALEEWREDCRSKAQEAADNVDLG
jgi:hypothetical protein